MRTLDPKIAALVSAVLVVFTGNVVHGEGTMSKNLSRSRPTVPPVYTTRSGSRYVRSIDVIRSVAGRKELDRQVRNAPSNGVESKATKTADKSNP